MKKTDELTTEALIVRLASSAGPVTPLRPPAVRAVQWSLVTLAIGFLAVIVVGPRRDWAQAIVSPAFAVSLTLLFVATFSAALAACVLGVPGAERSWLQRAVPVIGALAWPAVWVFVLIGASVSMAPARKLFHSACALEILAISAVCGWLLWRMVRRAAPLRPGWTAAMISLASVAAASAATQIICPLSDPAHQLIGHVLVAATIGIVALGVGRRALQQ